VRSKVTDETNRWLLGADGQIYLNGGLALSPTPVSMASIETGLINLAVGGGLDPELFKDDEAQPSLFTDIDGYRFT
jgi:hypothetical protein